MPPWGTRHWHVLRASFSASSALWRLQKPSYPKHCAALRSYTQPSPQHASKSPETSALNSAIIIPSSVSVTPENLISHIQPVDKQSFTKDRFAVFFLTPAFATWLLDDHAFVKSALTRLYQHVAKAHEFPELKVHALCAVVDKLPTPQYITNFGEIAKVENAGAPAMRRTREPPVWDIGHEGMAYATFESSDFVPLPQVAADEAGSISFITSEGPEEHGTFGDTLRLPLANTIFQTGLPTTMTHFIYENVKEASGLTLKTKENLNHHGLRLFRQKTTTITSTALAIPLIPLCFPRSVMASMGNILRQISDGTPTNQSQPASQELESLVPRFHKSRGEPPQAIVVWALVIPQALQSSLKSKTQNLLKKLRTKEDSGIDKQSSASQVWEALWRSDPVMWNELVTNAIKKGARLHRVLSGGGGWGKKAGLLSLDPVITSTESESSASQKFSDQLDGPGDLSSALHPVAHPGDAIQFFVSPPEPNRDVGKINLDTAKQNELESASSPWQWEVGTIPSTIDALQASSWQHNDADSKEVFVFRDCFGALAEGGMSFKRHLHTVSRDSVSVVGGTKIDVPFSRFCSVDFPIEKKEGSIHNSPIPEVFRNTKSKSTSIKDLFGTSTSSLSEPHVTERDNPVARPRKQKPAKLRIRMLPTGLIIKIMSKVIRTYNSDIKPDSNSFQVYLKDMQRSVEHMETELQYLVASIRQRQWQPQTLDTPIVPIRKILHVTSEPEHFTDRFLKIEYALQDLEFDLGTILTSIREFSKEVCELYDYLIEQIGYLDISDAEIYALQTDFRHVLETRMRNILTTLYHRSTRIEITVFDLRMEMAKILNFISARAHLIHLTNTSAIDIYNLHILLRWRLAAMILFRQQKNYPISQIAPFEKKLVHLRSFQSMLFAYKDNIKEQYIYNKLDALEQSNVFLRPLRLSEAALRRHRVNRLNLSKAQAIEKAREIGLHRAIRGTRLKANGKIRYSLDKVPIRLNRRSSNPLTRKTPAGRLQIRAYESDGERGRERRLLMEGKEVRRVLARRVLAGRVRVRALVPKPKFNSAEIKRDRARSLVDTVSAWLGLGVESEKKEEK